MIFFKATSHESKNKEQLSAEAVKRAKVLALASKKEALAKVALVFECPAESLDANRLQLLSNAVMYYNDILDLDPQAFLQIDSKKGYTLSERVCIIKRNGMQSFHILD